MLIRIRRPMLIRIRRNDPPLVLQSIVSGCRVALVALALAQLSVGRNPSIAQAPATDPPKQPSVTRADLAASYLRLEQAYFAAPPTGEIAATINRGFDRATLAFFTGRSAEALRQIDALTGSLQETDATTAQRAAASLRVSIEPPVVRSAQPLPLSIHLQSLYDAPLSEAQELPLELTIAGPKGKPISRETISVKCGPACRVDTRIPLELDATQRTSGLYRIELGPAGGRGIAVGLLNVVEGPALNAQRATNAKRLDGITAVRPRLEQALATCRARNQLLSDEPSPANSAQFLTDLNALAQNVSQEVAALSAGNDPYDRRPGDYWRVLAGKGGDVPLRVYASEAAVKDSPVPLIIVLHGAGGDENMFPEAYGVGLIKQLAEKHGLLIASPSTYRFGSSPARIAELVEALSLNYALDRDRVYILGHSMGAGAAARLASGQAKTIAAACCIAGGNNFQSSDGMPPLLVLLAELDGVVPVKSVKAAADQAMTAGMPVELKIIPDYGHTLVVGHELPLAIAWLLEHQRPTNRGG